MLFLVTAKPQACGDLSAGMEVSMRRRRGLVTSGVASHVSGFLLEKKQVSWQLCNVSPTPFSFHPYQAPRTHHPRRHKEISRPHIWETFSTSFAICYLSFLTKTFSQTSWGGCDFTIQDSLVLNLGDLMILGVGDSHSVSGGTGNRTGLTVPIHAGGRAHPGLSHLLLSSA